MPRVSKIFLLLLVSLFLLVLIVAAGVWYRFVPRKVAEVAMKPVELQWWRVFDDEDSVSEIIKAYRELHPNVTVSYRKLRFDEYEQTLLEALAEDRGPDILSLHNTSIRKYTPRILPLPLSLTLPFREIRGTIKKELVTELKTVPTLSPQDVKERFVEAVADDVIVPLPVGEGAVKQGVVALPLALDTLVIYVNRDLLNAKGIPLPPATWAEFQEQVVQLTEQDEQGEITISGAALGGSMNIPRYFDILSVLMMQNGAEMANEGESVLFHQTPSVFPRDRRRPPGEEALIFYTDFARPAKEVYTWNQNLPDALEMFTSGRLAFFFGYAYQLPTIRAKAPKLNFTIAPLPQLSGTSPKVNFANYWVEAVSSKTKNPDWAWDFLLFATAPQNVQSYLSKVQKPTALRALIAGQEQDPALRVFTGQVLTAKSWYRGRNSPTAEQAFAEMIELTVSEELEPNEAVGLAAVKVQETYR